MTHSVTRTITITARVTTVFSFFTDAARFASWFGAGSTIDARPGGAVRIVFPGGQLAGGTIRDLSPTSISFTFGYEGKPLAPGSSLLTFTFAEDPTGTRVTLTHTNIPTAADAAEQEQGWRYQLSLFSKAVCAAEHTSATIHIDHWLSLWGETDAAKRAAVLHQSCAPSITFHDAFSALFGAPDIDAHVAAAAIHMPGVRLHRVGDISLSHATALANWEARTPDRTVGKGTNVFDFAPSGLITRVVGFWS